MLRRCSTCAQACACEAICSLAEPGSSSSSSSSARQELVNASAVEVLVPLLALVADAEAAAGLAGDEEGAGDWSQPEMTDAVVRALLPRLALSALLELLQEPKGRWRAIKAGALTALQQVVQRSGESHGAAAAVAAALAQLGQEASAGSGEGPSCANCGAGNGPELKLSQCSRCRGVWYCCKSCQRADWAQHKAGCKPAGP